MSDTRFARITRINPASGGIDRPWRSRDHYFELAPVDPSTGASDLARLRQVDSYNEALELVGQGWAIRMGDGQSQPVLAEPTQLCQSHEPYEQLDELWTYTMPAAPFSREALLADLRDFLMRHAAAIRLIAGRSAATAFIGSSAHGPEEIDLGSFELTRLVMAAYVSAFRTGDDRPLRDEDSACIEHLLDMILRPGRHRAGSGAASGAAGDFPALRHTIRCAWLRCKIAQGTLDGGELDLPLSESLGAMAGLCYQATRNALGRDKIKVGKGAPSCDDIAAWLQHRRDFHPLRACESPRMPATRAALALLSSRPLESALAEISRQNPDCAPDGADLERQLIETARDGAVPPAIIRDYARAWRLCIDSFVAGFPRSTAADVGLAPLERRIVGRR
jgi:hypothetical protein